MTLRQRTCIKTAQPGRAIVKLQHQKELQCSLLLFLKALSPFGVDLVTLYIFFILERQHYTLNKVKKVKNIIAPLYYSKCNHRTLQKIIKVIQV